MVWQWLHTLKFSTRLSSWNKLLRSNWRVTGFTSTGHTSRTTFSSSSQIHLHSLCQIYVFFLKFEFIHFIEVVYLNSAAPYGAQSILKSDSWWWKIRTALLIKQEFNKKKTTECLNCIYWITINFVFNMYFFVSYAPLYWAGSITCLSEPGINGSLFHLSDHLSTTYNIKAWNSRRSLFHLILLFTHLSWIATISLVQQLTGHPGQCGPAYCLGFWSHMDNISSSSVRKKNTSKIHNITLLQRHTVISHAYIDTHMNECNLYYKECVCVGLKTDHWTYDQLSDLSQFLLHTRSIRGVTVQVIHGHRERKSICLRWKACWQFYFYTVHNNNCLSWSKSQGQTLYPSIRQRKQCAGLVLCWPRFVFNKLFGLVKLWLKHNEKWIPKLCNTKSLQ